MRYTLTLILPLTLALLVLTTTLAALAASHTPIFNHTTATPLTLQTKSTPNDHYDDQGNLIHFYDDGGDPAGGDESAAALVKRRSYSSSSCEEEAPHPHLHHNISAEASWKPLPEHTSPDDDCEGQDEEEEEGEELMSSHVLVTWYASHDLLYPACETGSWNPTSNAHIGAVSSKWLSAPSCGDFIKLCNEQIQPPKCITIRRLDSCPECHTNHIDLTKAAFRALSPSGGLEEGVVRGVKMYRAKKVNPWNLSLFGPFKLGI